MWIQLLSNSAVSHFTAIISEGQFRSLNPLLIELLSSCISVLRLRGRGRVCDSWLVENYIHEFFIVEGPIAILIIDLEELEEVVVISEDSDLCNSLLECGKVDFSRVLEVKELERPQEESLFILQCGALLLKFVLECLLKSIRDSV